MKIQGKIAVELSDTDYQYQPYGVWEVTCQDGSTHCPYVWGDDDDPGDGDFDDMDLAARLNASGPMAWIEATSATGKTGVKGEILAQAGRHLVVQGEAWGATSAASLYNDRVGWTTHTAYFAAIDAYYHGSLDALRGMRADEALLERIEGALADMRSQRPDSLGGCQGSPNRAHTVDLAYC